MLPLPKRRYSATEEQDGICFQGYRYINQTLAPYLKEEVLIRYDPIDLTEIHVFYQDRFVCCVICQELAGQAIRLKEIEAEIPFINM